MTICNFTEVCDINEHNIPCLDCQAAEWVQEYQDIEQGKSPCRCSACIEETEG